MLEENLDPRIQYTGNNVTTVFAIPASMKFFVNEDIVIKRYVISTGVESTVPTSEYTLAGAGSELGGSATFTVAPTTDHRLTIERDPEVKQGADYVSNNGFPAATHELQMDKIVAMIQTLHSIYKRGLKILSSSTTLPPDIPQPIAQRFLYWDGSAFQWQAVTTTTTAYGATFSTGLDASKPASPSVSDIYFAYDTGIIYVCKSGGVWTNYTVYIDSYAAKTTLANADLFLIEDSAAGLAKKKVTFANLIASITDLNKVKADSGDASPGYLDAKVDADTLEVTSGDKVAIKAPYIGALKFRNAKTLPEWGVSLDAASAIMQDGTLRVWGAGVKIGIGDSAGDLHLPGIAALPSSATYPIAKVYHAASNIFCIDADGKVYGAGLNAEGELADGTVTASYKFKRIGTLTGVSKLVIPRCPTATISVFALKTNGELWAWGLNTSGQLGVGTLVNVTTPTQVTGTWLDVACAGPDPGFAVGIKNDNKAYSTGINGVGQLGHGDLVTRSSFTAIAALAALNISKVYATGNNADGCLHFITDTGAVYACGDNSVGQLCTGGTVDSTTPIVIASLTGVASITNGHEASPCFVALKTDGTIRTWGFNGYGQLGDGTAVDRTTIYNPGLADITKVVMSGTAAFHTIYALKSDGTIYNCGYRVNGNGGDGTIVTLPYTFTECLGVRKEVVADISALGYSSSGALLVRTTGGQVHMCGINTTGFLGNGTNLALQPTLQPVAF